MKKPDITKLSKELIEYITKLENICYGATELQAQLSLMCHVLAEDMKLANSGATEGFKLLSGNKDDKIFERLMTMVKMKSDFALLSLLPKEDEQPIKGTKSKLKSTENPFETVVKELKNGTNV